MRRPIRSTASFRAGPQALQSRGRLPWWETFLVVVLRSNREGVTSSIPITPTIQFFQPRNPAPTPDRPFLWDFARIVPLFRSPVTFAVSQGDLNLPSRVQKFRSRGRVSTANTVRQPGKIGSLLGPKATVSSPVRNYRISSFSNGSRRLKLDQTGGTHEGSLAAATTFAESIRKSVAVY